jgi:hypothetical protein
VLEIAAELDADGETPHELVQAMARGLRERGSTIIVLEDLHWADEATLDVVRMLARRLESVPVLLAATYRDDSLDRRHPLRLVLGELPSSRHVIHLTLSPLSAEAVATLAGPTDGAVLHRQTGGNPFFVTEVIAAGGAKLPTTVREAVLARTARLDDPARRLLDAVAIVPPRAELDLLQALVDGYPNGLDECLSSGMLVSTNNAVAFRTCCCRGVFVAAQPARAASACARHARFGAQARPRASRASRRGGWRSRGATRVCARCRRPRGEGRCTQGGGGALRACVALR